MMRADPELGVKRGASVRKRRLGRDMKEAFLIGAGQTPVNRNAEPRGRDLAVSAIQSALDDCGIEPTQVNALFIGNMTGGVLGQQQQLGSLIADYAGLTGTEAVNIEAACASGAAAARMAYLSIAGGMHDIVVACGVERMAHVDNSEVTAALATATDWQLEGRHGASFLSLNAQLMRAYIERFNVSRNSFAAFSIVAHANAAINSNAVFHKEIDLDTYADSRTVIDPLRLYDISPVCNGAAAIVLASGDVAKSLRRNAPGVRIEASTASTAPVALARRDDPLRLDAVKNATDAAFASARLDRKDLDLLELHDAYTIMTALSLEAAGFAAPGTATHFAADKRIGLDGDLPLSTFGGLKARGHPVGATGVYQLTEAYLQLTGRGGPNQVAGAETAMTQNIGGTGSTVINHILRRVD